MTLDEALNKLWDGNSIAFLGSGFSKGATNCLGKDFPCADEFKGELQSEAGAPSEGTLADAADSYRAAKGDSALVQLLIERFTTSTVGTHHESLASIPWRRVYTTNYDNVFEVAAAKGSKKITSVTLKMDPYAIAGLPTSCVHLNGSILDLQPEDLDTALKLTDTSYVSSSIASSPWALTFRDDIRVADAIFFIGYSLFDLDVKRLLHEAPHLSSKTFFILGSAPSALMRQRIEKYGALLDMGASELSIATERTRPAMGAVLKPTFKSLVQFKALGGAEKIRDDHVFDLFELGDFKASRAESSIATGDYYFCQRGLQSKVLEMFESGTLAVVITGALGNGKTLFGEGLSIDAAQRGYVVFHASEKTPTSSLEFERVAQSTEPTILVVDDYSSWFAELRAFAKNRTGKVHLLLTARETVHDINFERLERELNLGAIAEVNLDRLSIEEVRWWVNCLDRYGLWGESAGESSISKERLIRDACEGQIQGILLRMLKSGEIRRRLLALVERDGKRCPYLDVAASVFVLATLKTKATRIEVLGDIWGLELLSSSAFRKDPTVCTLLDFDHWTIRVRSSVVAEFFLRHVFAADIVPVLIKIMNALSAGYRGNIPSHRGAFEELIRFSTLQHVLPDKGRLDAAVRFYEGIKSLPQCERHPLFWLQFGIACLAENDLRRASAYFDTAYSYAKAKDFDPFQIDNHYARFLLAEASQSDLPIAQAMENFRRARTIINRQLQRERVSYPFRVAAGYQAFFDRFRSKFNKTQLLELLAAVDFIEAQLHNAGPNVINHRGVRECVLAMKHVREQCQKLAS